MKSFILTALLATALCGSRGVAQTFFETAKDDGVISFSKKGVSQLKLNLSSTALSFGYNKIWGNAAQKRRFILSADIKAKPNDDGIATLVKTGNLQPGLKSSLSVGFRLADLLGENLFFHVVDIYFKPAYQLNGFTIYDTTRVSRGMDAVYETNKSSFSMNGLCNILLSPGKTNIYFGLQYGKLWTNTGDDLDKGTIQTLSPYLGSPAQTVATDIKEVKVGSLKNVEKAPFKLDLIFDPGIQLNKNDKTNIRLGLFGYFRNDGKLKKYREGFGICFLDEKNPSKIFSSVGYELPTTGADVKPEVRKKDKGLVFFSIGYSIF